MNSNFKFIIIFCLIIIFLSEHATGQIQNASYTLTPLTARYLDSTNPKGIIIVFKHVSESRKIEKLTISGRITYIIGLSSEEKTDILGSGTNKHSVIVFGKDIAQKDNYIYNLIKNNPDFSVDEGTRFLVFILRNVTSSYVDRITFKYGLWEPSDENVRIETTYQIHVDK